MSYAIKIGTPGWIWIHDEPTPEGFVRVEQEPPKPANAVWDEKLQSSRLKNDTELAADALLVKRALIKAQVVDNIVDSILAGKIPSDPVMADVAAKVASADAAVADVLMVKP